MRRLIVGCWSSSFSLSPDTLKRELQQNATCSRISGCRLIQVPQQQMNPMGSCPAPLEVLTHLQRRRSVFTLLQLITVEIEL